MVDFESFYRILGLYTTGVIIVSQFIRKNVSEMAPKIMFEDLPYVDRILRLCLDIYLVRENGELCLEEDLFAKLIFLYRSPETLIRSVFSPHYGYRKIENPLRNGKYNISGGQDLRNLANTRKMTKMETRTIAKTQK